MQKADSGRSIRVPKSMIRLYLRFATSRSENSFWHNFPEKILLEEYFIMDDITFVGIIGGTLGLFVGLSFIDLVSMFFEAASFM